MASVDFFLKLDGIQGESTDSKHKNEIELEAWSWGESNSSHSTDVSGLGSGKVTIEPIHFTKIMDKSTPKLMQYCASLQPIKSATLTCRKAGKEQQEYLTVKLSDTAISSFQTGGSGREGLIPVDHFSLVFTKIEFEYKQQNPDGSLGGSVKGGWNAAENKTT